jgi:hypothetical protein
LTLKPICDLVTRCESTFWEVSLRLFCDRARFQAKNPPQEAIGYLLTYVAAAIPDDVPQRICNMGIGLTNLMRISTKSFHRDTHDHFLQDRERVSQKVGSLLGSSRELIQGNQADVDDHWPCATVRFRDLRRTSDVVRDLMSQENLFRSVLSAWQTLNWPAILGQSG